MTERHKERGVDKQGFACINAQDCQTAKFLQVVPSSCTGDGSATDIYISRIKYLEVSTPLLSNIVLQSNLASNPMSKIAYRRAMSKYNLTSSVSVNLMLQDIICV